MKILKYILLPLVLLSAVIGLIFLYLGALINAIGYLFVWNKDEALKALNLKRIINSVW